MPVLVLGITNLANDTNQLIHLNIKHSALKVQPQILAFIAVNLSMVYNDADFRWEPVGATPHLLDI
jgi:hypothetical protein